MENNPEMTPVNPEEESYVPRPQWQVWGARVGLVLFIIFVLYQILGIARGGL